MAQDLVVNTDLLGSHSRAWSSTETVTVKIENPIDQKAPQKRTLLNSSVLALVLFISSELPYLT